MPPSVPATYRRHLLLSLAVFILALAPRLGGLARVATWDELFWTHAALRFHSALATTHWSRTYIIGQPGVTPLWVWSGIIGLDGMLAGPEERARLIDLGDRLRESRYPEDDPALLREVAAVWRGIPLALGTALATALLTALLAAVLALRWGAATAGLAALRLAWDPYVLAHSRVVALDAILMGLCLLSVALAAEASRDPRRRRTLLAGAAVAGLAMLAKLPGGAALAWGAGLVALGAGRAAWRRGARGPTAPGTTAPGMTAGGMTAGGLTAMGHGLARGALWTVVALSTWTLAWPAMWKVPLKTLGKLRDTLITYQQTAYDGMFFLGQAGQAPGPRFYPAVLLWRSLPFTLIGLGILVAAGLWAAIRAIPYLRSALRDGPPSLGTPPPPRGAQLLACSIPFLGFALFYGAILSLADSKFERYLLPALGAVNVAVSLAAGSRLVGRIGRATDAGDGASGEVTTLVGGHDLQIAGRRGRPWPWLWPRLAFLLLLLEPLAGRGWQDGLAWYNPLVGGFATAQGVLPAGWGEGTEQAAAFLAGLPQAAELTVATDGAVSLVADFPGRLLKARGEACRDADYVVVYIFDRQLGTAAARTYGGAWGAAAGPAEADGPAAVFVGRVRGQDWVWVYEGGRSCGSVPTANSSR